MERQMACMGEYNREMIRALETRDEVREAPSDREVTEGRVLRVLREMKGFSDVIIRGNGNRATAECWLSVIEFRFESLGVTDSL